jgi:hypothetical protein
MTILPSQSGSSGDHNDLGRVVPKHYIDPTAADQLPIALSIGLGWQPGLVRVSQHVKDLVFGNSSLAYPRQGMFVKCDGITAEHRLGNDTRDGHRRPLIGSFLDESTVLPQTSNPTQF